MLAAGICKLSRRFLHLAGRGGTSLPGKLAMALDKDILCRVSAGMHVILVTGTNGKTTTCRRLEKAILQGGKTCLLNRSGANLLAGITAEFVCASDWQGRALAEYAVIECDEGALKQVTQRITPDLIVVTNLFRDQLDRYGEVMHTRDEILKGIRNTSAGTLCLNADCPLTASLAEGVSGRVLYYGINIPVGEQEDRELSDAKYCLHCGSELSYTYYTYAHLGSWYCPKCGRRRPPVQAAVTRISEKSLQFTDIMLTLSGAEQRARIGIPGIYNVYNALAAVTAGTALGLPMQQLLKAVRTTKAPFGRMESFDLSGHSLRMILVKNPAGCNQAIEYITGGGEDYAVVLCLNDRTADGHDISWIWDADYEKIIQDPHLKLIWVSGVRAEDMQLRLKYAGASENSIRMEKDYSQLIRDMKNSPYRLFVMPNYTSMLDFREALIKETGGNEFWKG